MYGILFDVDISLQYAQNKFNLKKALILDWDVHHGNGTQEIFAEVSDMYIRIENSVIDIQTLGRQCVVHLSTST